MADRPEEISRLQRELDSLIESLGAEEKQPDGSAPSGAWARSLARNLQIMIRDPDDDRHVENLEQRIQELKEWLAQNQ